ncbi:MAG: DUF3883 domain-containing protein [Terracidiphilus sp.]|nr:DUF3883 domain-containing protein [Terracidiphilus sp.]MDR3799611.1 DUF3883 domain-containing protein [Terracidiphilus sp.]
MNLNPARIATREKLILTGIYLSKFGRLGLKRLGFRTFAEAYNVVGYALGSRPSSIKNYRDEFDPFFPNARMGWHKREIRGYCKKVLDEYQGLDFDSFSGLVMSFVGYSESASSAVETDQGPEERRSGFARRLITGLAAERYFETVHATVPEFRGCEMENTTQLGCGYDFKLSRGAGKRFLAVEVKGLREQAGGVSLTPREYDVAAEFQDRFFLFVVKNFQKTPYHEIFPNPLAGNLRFTRTERVLIQVSWLTRV